MSVCTWASGWGQFLGLRGVAWEVRGHLLGLAVGVHCQPPLAVGLSKTDTNQHVQTEKRHSLCKINTKTFHKDAPDADILP